MTAIETMKQEYIKEITNEINKTNDLSLLDLIHQLLVKSNRKN